LQNDKSEFAKDFQLRLAEFRAELAQNRSDSLADQRETVIKFAQNDESKQIKEQSEKIDQLMQVIKDMQTEQKAPKPKRAIKAVRTANGYEIGDMVATRTPTGFDIN
jgi:hypothetical protein